MLPDWVRAAATLLVEGAFYAADFIFIQRYDRLRVQGGSGRSTSYTIFGLLTALVLVIQPLLLPQISLHIDAPWFALLQILGMVLSVAALTLNWWARTHLQQFYTEGAQVQEGHRVINTGPYAQVRHPVFTSLFMLVTGVMLINPSILTVAIALYTFWDFSHAAVRDEQVLLEKLPGYAEYMQQTSRFFPRLGARG
jgi:protein-S-isoprenylcysteine O-methyltransferase Ste14